MRLSKEEKAFCAEGIEEGVRCDGRDRLSTRHIQLQVFFVVCCGALLCFLSNRIAQLGVLAQASGSAMLKCGGTRVLVGVKAELMNVDPLFPNSGKVEVSCNTQSPLFDRNGDDISTELCSSMNKLLSDGISTKFYESLCVSSGQQCWNLYADASVLDLDGNLLDCLSMAVFAALANTAIPKIKILEGNEIELLDGPEDCTPMDVREVPVFVTLSQVQKRFIVDATAAEECCSDTMLCVGVNAAGNICGSHKRQGRGLHPSQLGQMLRACQQLGQQRIQKLSALIAQKRQGMQQELMEDLML